MGICGTAMGNVALLMRDGGHSVLGADAGVYPPMSDVLAEAGIDVYEGFDPERLDALEPDLVVVGNAISRGNPEVEWLLQTRALPFVSLPQLLHDQVLQRRRNIVVAGTHGKTTTTALTTYLLRSAGRMPGYLVGGVPLDLPGGAAWGAGGDPFVIEGDEYDSAFFDKRSKFIHYWPNTLIINNLEFDHGDIFRDLRDVQRSFGHVMRLVPADGFILINGDESGCAELPEAPWTTVYRVGQGPENDLRLVDFSEGPSGATFGLEWQGAKWGTVAWAQPGLYNARNAAMAALAAGLATDSADPTALSLYSLNTFRGVKRRQEVHIDTPELTVIEDFGHHPTAIAGTLEALRARHPEKRLVVALEPRSNTLCTNRFQDRLTRGLASADVSVIGPVHRPERYPDEARLDPAAMVAELRKNGREAESPGSCEGVLDVLLNGISHDAGPRTVCFFSNGAFGGIIGKYVAACNAE